MARMLLVFILTFAFVYGGIEVVKRLSKSEKWALTKQLGYSIIIAVVTVALLTTIVILF